MTLFIPLWAGSLRWWIHGRTLGSRSISTQPHFEGDPDKRRVHTVSPDLFPALLTAGHLERVYPHRIRRTGALRCKACPGVGHIFSTLAIGSDRVSELPFPHESPHHGYYSLGRPVGRLFRFPFPPPTLTNQ